jgi:hypothetical protein
VEEGQEKILVVRPVLVTIADPLVMAVGMFVEVVMLVYFAPIDNFEGVILPQQLLCAPN